MQVAYIRHVFRYLRVSLIRDHRHIMMRRYQPNTNGGKKKKKNSHINGRLR